MPTIFTCGSYNKRTQFSYDGSLEDGFTIHFDSGDALISSLLVKTALGQFRGKEVIGGFSMTNPTPGGFGQWVTKKSRSLNKKLLTPRHGSFIAGILRDLGYLECRLDRNAVIIKFKG